MLTRNVYVAACDTLDNIAACAWTNPNIVVALRNLEVLLTEQLLADVKKGHADKTLTPEEVKIGQERGKINCIKAYRERTGLGLKDAKDAVEAHFVNENLHFGW